MYGPGLRTTLARGTFVHILLGYLLALLLAGLGDHIVEVFDTADGKLDAVTPAARVGARRPCTPLADGLCW